MPTRFELRAGSQQQFSRYVASQLHGLFPLGALDEDVNSVATVLAPALDRMRPILAAVRNFDPQKFDHFHSLQYASFLYLLSREAVARGLPELADRLFYLNRTLNSIDLYHRVELGEIFFISHGLGAVLGNARYGTRLVLFQNITLGRVGENRPTIGAGVILYPGCSVTGSCVVGNNCIIGAHVRVHNATIPDDMIVSDVNGEAVTRPREKDFLSLYFRS
jgi:serine O-acetyltransferase